MLLTVIKMIIGLVIVIYLINIFLKYLNHYSLKTNKALRILQKIPVSKSSSIGIVQILDHVYVMSFSESQNQILFELSVQEAHKLLKIIDQQNFSDTKQTKQAFQELIKKFQDNLQSRYDNKKRKK
ncbi:flagellar biosynthetic protein FliO [Liquorilactobacillus sicerae]|uniref:flagellar biosynthetic protein FliO n=1 Tax=Liquorilactobacillus sicerae TaxID=1416943 RepID=UPI00248101CA|nr:flagellar biosynthetic protein FliO [Liquorilactobacillus sicerae]